MDTQLLPWALGFLAALTVGSFSYTYLETRRLWRKIGELITNHIRHLEDRVKDLENVNARRR